MNLRQSLSSALSPFLPEPFIRWYQRRTGHPNGQERFENLSLLETFSIVYREGIWGQAAGQGFYSGEGSEDELAVPYTAAIQGFLRQHGIRSVADLGCGDFRIGRRLSTLVDHYNGVDCVPELIAHLSQTEAREGISFHCRDLTTDPLPPAGAALIRQVFQHLSNREIASVLQQCAHYPFIIVTEHVPAGPCAHPNLDYPHGPNTRLVFDSGVFLDRPPFSRKSTVLLEIPYEGDTVIRTIAIDNRLSN
ncbi:class I SAM-dependent methyltransferase [Paludibaculum fermentans]|uniref:class I SAM-dependent methyltransferase n=1 Tax=Paludibaculum fermentans TaxID=1473598 RepID=UPI003EBE0FD3